MTRLACLVDTISRNGGGLNSSVRGLMSGLQSLGHEVRIFSISDKYSKEDKKEWSEFDVNLSRPMGIRKLGFAPGLNRSLADFDADVLHSQGLWNYTSYACLKWGRQTRRPTVIHPHGMLDPWALNNSRWKKRLAMLSYERRNLENSACIRALCISELDSIRALGLKNPVCVIPNGIEIPGPESVDTGSIHSSKKLLLYLGRIHPKKGIAMLIQALAENRNAHAMKDWSVVIAGWDQGAHEAELKQQATRLGIAWSDLRDLPPSDHTWQSALVNPPPLVFTGPAFGTNKERIYRACSAFILPSLSEGLPMVILEAWSYGKPVVMTQMCNLPEGFTAGAAIQIGADVQSISEGLQKLAGSSTQELETMGARGLDLVKAKFTWPSIGEEMRRVNQWLISGGEAPESVNLFKN